MTNDILVKLHVHHHTIVLYILYKFNVIPSNGYLVRTEYGKTGERTKSNLYLSGQKKSNS